LEFTRRKKGGDFRDAHSLAYTCIAHVVDALLMYNTTLPEGKWAELLPFLFFLSVGYKFDANRLNKLNSVLKRNLLTRYSVV
jgi:hypothetical protein